MFQSFTGSSRRPRQVNLSGTRNPFAAAGGSAVLTAQQERERRQRERDRINTAKLLQRVWRGHSSRKKLRQQRREEWDVEEEDGQTPYQSENEALEQLQRFLHFANLGDDDKDVKRLRHYMDRLRLGQQNGINYSSGLWPMAFLRLQKVVLLSVHGSHVQDWQFELETVAFISEQIPGLVSLNARLLYRTIASLGLPDTRDASNSWIKMPTIIKVIRGPLESLTAASLETYEAFACEFLTQSYLTEDPWYPKWLNELADHVNYKLLASALSGTISSKTYHDYKPMQDGQSRRNLLGCFIYFHRHAHQFQNAQAYSSHKDFVHVISALLSSIADSNYLEALQNPNPENELGLTAMGGFARDQIMSLVNQESIGSLLWGASNSPKRPGSPPKMNSEAKQLANYALTLLRFFPRRGDEIRMWLYLGSTGASTTADPEDRIPAIKFFWQAARSCMVFKTISQDPRSVVRLTKPQPPWDRINTNNAHTEWVQDDWWVILIFLELYTFVLKLMDDEEFFSSSPLASSASSTSGSTWASNNALPVEDVQELTLFLKNLGFTMYFHSKDIVEENDPDSDPATLSSYFKVASPDRLELKALPQLPKTPETAIAGLSGISIDYVKGLVTGLLRMVHERDSRRKFLPQDHWLMTSLFDMSSFIPDVVAEEESRHRIQEDDDDEDNYLLDEQTDEDNIQLVGTARDRNIRYHEQLERQQRRASRRRYLQNVAPRSEILQNMPFFIPFTTRVQIFREFVRRDQYKRRHGMVDAELWRINMMNSFDPTNNLARHTATIRRKHEFEDAYEQFYSLKDGLKEPIQITFMDQFGGQEAGIDGGGVTKEFLTSVTNQAFTPSDGLDLFSENEQHLLYPNPAAYEEQKEILKNAGLRERTEAYNRQMNDLFQRYEFLGRIIGKCLYEGILVDINFAGFFLLKWALTGGDGAAPKESGYRANLNDLRDLDEDLYKGLIQLKNYSGDVEDFALNFTVSDTITTDYATGATKTVTGDLKRDGANIPVTNQNRLVYISYMARHRLQVQPARQTTAFLRGLSSMISPSWLSMFNQSELQTLIGGTSSSIDVEDLRRNTQYGGVYVTGDDPTDHPTVEIFWRVMESFTDKERRAVLKFVTSTPRAPLLGFGSLTPRFSVRDSGDDETRLPSASTCVNLLKLPRYKSDAVMREKLLYAVLSGAGFDLS